MKKVTAMVALSFVGMLCWAFTADSLKGRTRKAEIMGNWRIQKVQNKSNGEMTTVEKSYTVSFSPNSFSVHLDINRCLGTVRITSNTIRTLPQTVTCTQACCDTKEASHLANIISSNSLKYYYIKNNQLTVEDNQYTVWLTKTK